MKIQSIGNYQTSRKRHYLDESAGKAQVPSNFNLEKRLPFREAPILLVKMPLVFPMPNTKSQQTSLKILMKTVNPIPLDFASLTTANNETLDIKKTRN